MTAQSNTPRINTLSYYIDISSEAIKFFREYYEVIFEIIKEYSDKIYSMGTSEGDEKTIIVFAYNYIEDKILCKIVDEIFSKAQIKIYN